MSERRKFERVTIPESAGIQVSRGKQKVGAVCMLGHGGLLVQTGQKFKKGQKLTVVLSDQAKTVSRRIPAVVRYARNGETGFEFVKLDAETAIDIGVLIGRALPLKKKAAKA